MAAKKRKNELPYSVANYQRKLEDAIRRNIHYIAPYVVLLLAATLLFLFSTLISTNTTFIERNSLDFETPTQIQIPNENTIYVFNLEQEFTSSVPSYSELEIELLDENFNHVYSVYKDLWKESHTNDDGGKSIYSDKILEFELDLKHSGLYYIRPTSHNNHNTGLTLNLYKKRGSLYYLFFTLLFGAILSIILISIDWALNMHSLLLALRRTKITQTFILAINIVIFVFISCVVISYTHYGYPHSGDEIRLPTQFFSTNDVIYLG